MARAIRFNDRTNLTSGISKLGQRMNRQGSVAEQTHDGDTVIVTAVGDIGVRLLGIDTAEVSFRFPGTRNFVGIEDARWKPFLADPFAKKWPEFSTELPAELVQSLKGRLRENASENHHRHARAAEMALEREIISDVKVMQKTIETFQMFMVFGYEIMDGYGRFLCFINRNQPDRNKPAPRPLSYNERLLKLGQACPYFIWPNVNPWRKQDSVLKAVPDPKGMKRQALLDRSLGRVRRDVAAARAAHRGIFHATDPLQLEPFELRFLSRRSGPSRWVIDLNADDGMLLRPENYYRIPNSEDRLFVSPEHVPLFVERGWKREASA